MKLFLILLLSISLDAMEQHKLTAHKHEHHLSEVDLEKAIQDIAEIKKEKPACRLTKARVAALTSVASAAITAAITIATLYKPS